jgi:hypothetical protein
VVLSVEARRGALKACIPVAQRFALTYVGESFADIKNSSNFLRFSFIAQTCEPRAFPTFLPVFAVGSEPRMLAPAGASERHRTDLGQWRSYISGAGGRWNITYLHRQSWYGKPVEASSQPRRRRCWRVRGPSGPYEYSSMAQSSRTALLVIIDMRVIMTV